MVQRGFGGSVDADGDAAFGGTLDDDDGGTADDRLSVASASSAVSGLEFGPRVAPPLTLCDMRAALVSVRILLALSFSLGELSGAIALRGLCVCVCADGALPGPGRSLGNGHSVREH